MVSFERRINELNSLLNLLASDGIQEKIFLASEIIVEAFSKKRPLLICGNGGSASDANHIAGELVGQFLLKRKALNVISLSANASVITAWSNDIGYESVFERQVLAHSQPGGVVLGISTSGNSQNVVRALAAAKMCEMQTIGLTGSGGGDMAHHCDVLLDAPSMLTPRIQEMHVIIYHYLCECIESRIVSVDQ
jgi:D-sedoheptulose 7-phosphate isomerase